MINVIEEFADYSIKDFDKTVTNFFLFKDLIKENKEMAKAFNNFYHDVSKNEHLEKDYLKGKNKHSCRISYVYNLVGRDIKGKNDYPTIKELTLLKQQNITFTQDNLFDINKAIMFLENNVWHYHLYNYEIDKFGNHKDIINGNYTTLKKETDLNKAFNVGKYVVHYMYDVTCDMFYVYGVSSHSFSNDYTFLKTHLGF